MATKDNTEAPWYAAFPEPSSQPENIEPVQVYELLDQQSISSDKARDFLLVDVRRTDWQGGTVESSINLPAHSFYPTRKIVYDLCKQAGIKNVIFYCGSSNGRGPRCAAWMQDFINDSGDASIQALVMTGGIKGWVKAYKGRRMDGYDATAWDSS